MNFVIQQVPTPVTPEKGVSDESKANPAIDSLAGPANGLSANQGDGMSDRAAVEPFPEQDAQVEPDGRVKSSIATPNGGLEHEPEQEPGSERHRPNGNALNPEQEAPSEELPRTASYRETRADADLQLDSPERQTSGDFFL